jgi:hypothetical protein
MLDQLEYTQKQLDFTQKQMEYTQQQLDEMKKAAIPEVTMEFLPEKDFITVMIINVKHVPVYVHSYYVNIYRKDIDKHFWVVVEMEEITSSKQRVLNLGESFAVTIPRQFFEKIIHGKQIVHRVFDGQVEYYDLDKEKIENIRINLNFTLSNVTKGPTFYFEFERNDEFDKILVYGKPGNIEEEPYLLYGINTAEQEK